MPLLTASIFCFLAGCISSLRKYSSQPFPRFPRRQNFMHATTRAKRKLSSACAAPANSELRICFSHRVKVALAFVLDTEPSQPGNGSARHGAALGLCGAPRRSSPWKARSAQVCSVYLCPGITRVCNCLPLSLPGASAAASPPRGWDLPAHGAVCNESAACSVHLRASHPFSASWTDAVSPVVASSRMLEFARHLTIPLACSACTSKLGRHEEGRQHE